jgi:hypothetical protein
VSESEDKARIKELEDRIRALELKTQAPPKVPVARPLEGMPASTLRAIDRMSIPVEDLRAMEKAVPTAMIQEIVRTGRK